MDQKKIERINEFARRVSLVGQLDNTYIVEPDGTKHRLPKRS